MRGWILVLFVLAAFGYLIYLDEKNAPTPEQRKVQEAAHIAEDVGTMCVKGVLYYYTTGAHSARMAPAIDQVTLSFIRCK
ncbi:hypothetical protein D3C87_1304440 [compost metagenome]